MQVRAILAISLVIVLPLAAIAQELNEELLTAARKGNAEAVKALLGKGADVNARTQYGATPLSYAADKGHVDVVRILLEGGADINVRDTFYKQSPIGWAAYNGHAEVVRLLLGKGATGKEMGLVTATVRGHSAVVTAILDSGGLKPETLTMALATAKRNEQLEIAALLEKAGAVPPAPADFKVDLETLNSYAGAYRNDRGLEVVVIVKDDKLVGRVPGQPPLTFGAVDKVTFRPAEVDGITVIFKTTEGKVSGFTLREGGTVSEFVRVDKK